MRHFKNLSSYPPGTPYPLAAICGEESKHWMDVWDNEQFPVTCPECLKRRSEYENTDTPEPTSHETKIGMTYMTPGEAYSLFQDCPELLDSVETNGVPTWQWLRNQPITSLDRVQIPNICIILANERN